MRIERTNNQELNDLLGSEIKILDKGFIRLIDYMGDDAAIVQAARVSYGKGTKQKNEDRGLIRYLMKHRHTSPFEMCEIKLHIKMPIFVARQWIRHRTASLNEYSARYSVLREEFYIPDKKHIASQSSTNKQGRGESLSKDEANEVFNFIEKNNSVSYSIYEHLLNNDQFGIIDENKSGVARELARMVLPVNIYTEMYWKIDLHNLLHFLLLRIDSHAQYEIREYASEIANLLKKWVPLTWEAFEDYHLNGRSFGKGELALIHMLIHDKKIDDNKINELGLSKREISELYEFFKIKK